MGGREVLEGEVYDLQEESAPVLCTASVVVGSTIGKGSQEGIQDVAVGAVNLNSIKSSLLRQLERVLELVLHVLDIFQSCLLGDRIVNPREERNFLPCVDGRWSNWLESSVQLRVGDSASVVDLNEHLGSFRLDALDHLPPAFSLLFVVEAALVRVANGSLGDSNAFSQDQPCSSSLGVVLPHQIGGNSTFSASNAGQGGHDYSVFELECSKGDNVRPSFAHL